MLRHLVASERPSHLPLRRPGPVPFLRARVHVATLAGAADVAHLSHLARPGMWGSGLTYAMPTSIMTITLATEMLAQSLKWNSNHLKMLLGFR